jgi:glucokinase
MPIGVDFTGSVIRAGVVEDGGVVHSMTADTKVGAEPPEVLDTIARLVLALSPRPEMVGVAIPGEVNTDGRCWRLPNTVGFEGIPIGWEVSRRLGCPIAVENRATTAALAERLYGHGREHPSFLIVTLGTGIGGGLVIGHQLYPGSNGFGAEIGHVCVDTTDSAPLCTCGQRGCLEAFAGARALLRNYGEQGGKATDLAAMVVSARRGEWAALKTFESMGRALGRALAGVQNLLDLNAIVFSGGATAPFDLIETHVRDELRQRTFAPPLAEVPLLLSDLGESAGVIGAAYLTTL